MPRLLLATACAAVCGTLAFTTPVQAADETIQACAHQTTGQLRLAGAGGCRPSEVLVAWSVEGPPGAPGESVVLDPIDVSRTLTIVDPDTFNGIVGGLLCPAGRTLVSGGFKLLHHEVEIRESFVGEAFGFPRVYVVLVVKKTPGALPAADMVRLSATCL